MIFILVVSRSTTDNLTFLLLMLHILYLEGQTPLTLAFEFSCQIPRRPSDSPYESGSVQGPQLTKVLVVTISITYLRDIQLPGVQVNLPTHLFLYG